MTTHHNNNGTDAIKKITAITAMILSVSGVIALIVSLYGSQVFASKAELKEVKDNYLTKELFQARYDTLDVQLKAIARAVGARTK